MSRLIENAKNAVSSLFSDTSVGQQVTKARLEELQGFIQDMINTLEDQEDEEEEDEDIW